MRTLALRMIVKVFKNNPQPIFAAPIHVVADTIQKISNMEIFKTIEYEDASGIVGTHPARVCERYVEPDIYERGI